MKWFSVIGPDGQTYLVRSNMAESAFTTLVSKFRGSIGQTDLNAWIGDAGLRSQIREVADSDVAAYKASLPHLVIDTGASGSAGSLSGGGSNSDTDVDDGDGEITPDTDTGSGLERAGEYEAAYRNRMNSRPGATPIGGAGLWAQAQRQQFAPAFASYLGEDALGRVQKAGNTDQQNLEAFGNYINENAGNSRYGATAAKSFNDIRNYQPQGGDNSTIDKTVMGLRNPLAAGEGGDMSSGERRGLARYGYNIGRAGAESRQSSLWSRYVPDSDELYTDFLAQNGGEAVGATGPNEDWFGYLRRKGYA